MRYEVVGRLPDGRRLSWTWQDGEILDNALAKALLESWASAIYGDPIGFAGGTVYERAYLSDPVAALALARYAGIDVITISGDVPGMPPVPKDAVA